MSQYPQTFALPRRSAQRQAGFTMIEVLITFVILVVGLLGLIGLQVRSQQAEMESYQRGQALVLMQDMIDRLNTNRTDAHALAYVTASPVGGGGALTACSALAAGAPFDLCEWGNELNGAAEVSVGGTCDTASGAKCAGAMTGARGCIKYDALSELKDSKGVTLAGTGVYTITVVWQGVAPTVAPLTAVDCGLNLYAQESQRRAITHTLRIAALNAQ